ncbi:MAG: hypothetical protein HYR88_07860 [Verrucomicrobia bacterium]|nr:hypothetical protein [Verrucomicrobiota bacterium]MBI3868725.1 hypothetical protein [Verrucomicrobiota bacterium]
MKTIPLIFVCCLLAGSETSQAVTLASLEFDADNHLPSQDPGIALFNSTGSPEADVFDVSGGFLHQHTFDLGGSARYHSPNLQLTSGTLRADWDLRLEARFVVHRVGGPRGAFFEAFDGANVYSVEFTPGGVVVAAEEIGFSPVIPVSESEPHILRLESRSGTGEVLCFVDGLLRFRGLAPTKTTLNGFCWGDGSVEPGAGADIDWDYLRIQQQPPAILRIVQAQAHCGANTVTLSYNQPVTLEGSYTLENGVSVIRRTYGRDSAEVVLSTSLLAPRTAYRLTVRGVHSLETPSDELESDSSVWFVGCASACNELVSAPADGGAVTIGWGDPSDAIQTSTNLSTWWDLPGAVSPMVVPSHGLPMQFFRLTCDPTGTTNGPLPAFIRQPRSFGVSSGNSVSFEAQIVGLGPMSYQWFRNGTNLLGQTSDRLTLVAGSESDEGVYELRATNRFGVAWSKPGYLLLTPQLPPASWNTLVARPSVFVLLLRPARDFSFNTTLASEEIHTMSWGKDNVDGLSFNTTLASPPVDVFLLGLPFPESLPFNTTVAGSPVSVFLLGSETPEGLAWNTSIAQPPVQLKRSAF